MHTLYKQLTQAQCEQWQRWPTIGSVLLLLALIGSVSVEKEIAVQTTSDPVSLHLPFWRKVYVHCRLELQKMRLEYTKIMPTARKYKKGI